MAVHVQRHRRRLVTERDCTAFTEHPAEVNALAKKCRRSWRVRTSDDHLVRSTSRRSILPSSTPPRVLNTTGRME
jgi:hypothetical protein